MDRKLVIYLNVFLIYIPIFVIEIGFNYWPPLHFTMVNENTERRKHKLYKHLQKSYLTYINL